MNRPGRYIVLFLLLSPCMVYAQPAGYYAPADGLTGTELKQALHNIIDNHTVSTYTNLWTHFQSTDKRADGNVWDIYSTVTYQFITDQCGNYDSEGDCYNREHSFPKSWFGGEVSPMYTDLFHLYPTDGYVNGKRGNLPYGETSSATWTSSNGSRLGQSSVTGYTGEIFEPVDEYKGDLARSYLYMAVRYYGEDGSWPGSDMVDGAEPRPWALAMLLRWNTEDPVSQKETNRNEEIFNIQGNRNPFIDHNQYATAIWDAGSHINSESVENISMTIYPNPANSWIRYKLPENISGEAKISIMTIEGRIISTMKHYPDDPDGINISTLRPGLYLLIVESKNRTFRQKFMVVR